MKARLLAIAALSLTLIGTYTYAEDVVVIPDTVTTYVTEQPMDDATVVDGDVTVGTVLPDAVVVRNIPDNSDFDYAVVNKHRVIVQPSTRKVIRIVE